MTRHLKLLALLVGLANFGTITQANGMDCAWPCGYTCTQDTPVCDYTVGFEGLYWIVHQSDLDYAVDFTPGNIIGPKKTHFIDYDWEVGARGWIARNWNCGWDSKVVYTYYRNNTSNSVDKSDDPIALKASFLHPSTGKDTAEKASGYMELKYQTLDFLLGHFFPLCDSSCSVRPFFGVRALKIGQRLRALYEGGDFGTKTKSVPARVKWKSDLEALGLHAGLDMDYTICCIRLYGGIGGSVLGAKAHNQHRQDVLNHTKSTITAREIDLKETQWVMAPGCHLRGGISWERSCYNYFCFRVNIGYEYNHWFDLPQLKRYDYGNEGVSHSGSSGAIGLHGLTVSTDIYF